MGSISQSTWHAPESVEFNGTLKLGTKRLKSKIVQKPMSIRYDISNGRPVHVQ